MRIPNLIEAKKNVFGTYSAMALMNIQTVLDYIQQVAEITDIPDNPYYNDKKREDYWAHPVMSFLYSAQNTGKESPEKVQYVFEKLFKCFPFLKVMAGNQRDYNNKKKDVRKQRKEVNCNDVWYVLNNIFRVVKAYRDSSTHYIIDDNKFEDGSDFLVKNEQPLAGMVNEYYTVALRNTAKKYSYDTPAMAFIQDKRYKKVRGDDGRPKTLIDTDFFLSMQNKNGDCTGRLHLSGVGVTLLICLLLEKKYINVFLAKLNLGGSKYPVSSEEGKIIRRSMAMNSVVLPRERIRSDKSIESVSMDMLNELKRCPKELFDTLSFEGQSRFRSVSSDYNEVLQHRSTDRFAQMALEYIDYNRLFKNIRFHVNMGKLRYLFNAEKQCIDGQTRVRVLEHPLNGYGRLREMEHERTKNSETTGTFGDSGIKIRKFGEMRRDDAMPENYPYIVDTKTHYILENNKVEMRFCKNEKLMPTFRTKNGKWYVDKRSPSCRMSVLELPAMMFHLHLLGEEATEKRIREVYDNYVRLFKAMGDGMLTIDNLDSFGIAQADMPQKVLDAANGIMKWKSVDDFIEKTIDELYEETVRRMERLEADKQAVGTRDNKMGKRGFRTIVPGRFADFLAKDIVKFQMSAAEDGTDRLTGLNYRVMQASIAVYDSNGDRDAVTRFIDLFGKAGLTGRDVPNAHPFLQDALKRRPENAIDFYENYLFARKKYLEKLQAEIKKNNKCVNLPFINRNRKKWLERTAEYYQIIAGNYLYNKKDNAAIELPRQMFDEPIKECLKKKQEMAGIDFAKANVTYLIAEYMKRVQKDDFQAFYSWKRHYRYMDLLICKTDKRGSLCEQYTTVEERKKLWSERDAMAENYCKMARLAKQPARRAKQTGRNKRMMSDDEFEEILKKRLANSRNDYQKSEKIIRRYKVQDALLFLLAKDGLAGMVDFESNDFKLKDIMPDNDRGILSKIVAIDFKLERDGKTYIIHSDGMKIKNYGDFYALAHDKRLTSLLDLVALENKDKNTSVTVNKESIEKEFERYDDSRPEVVKLVFDFEKLAYEKYPEMKAYPALYHERGENFGFSALLSELIERKAMKEDNKEVLRQIRNAFEHNVYPKSEKSIVEITVLPEIAVHLVRMFDCNAKISQ